mmetsp:Transcript_37183/g.57090  ORF Transcript_37183/g.57090 Transcript_37183/m.57090 type:complete len:132 (-) Transcript_37183:124-519(-)
MVGSATDLTTNFDQHDYKTSKHSLQPLHRVRPVTTQHANKRLRVNNFTKSAKNWKTRQAPFLQHKNASQGIIEGGAEYTQVRDYLNSNLKDSEVQLFKTATQTENKINIQEKQQDEEDEELHKEIDKELHD